MHETVFVDGIYNGRGFPVVTAFRRIIIGCMASGGAGSRVDDADFGRDFLPAEALDGWCLFAYIISSGCMARGGVGL